MLHIDKDSTDAVAEINVGESFEVSLPENPTTGYRWITTDITQTTIVLTDDRFESEAKIGFGGGGVRRWRFTATKPGTIELKFFYQRSWENQHVDEFALVVRVR